MNVPRPQYNGVQRFGSYEVDLRTHELRRAGMLIRLYGQPFQVLTMLLERRGEIVTREELLQELWPNATFVDFDHSLNAAVNKLRQALRDSANNPRFVQTLPRRGYRFIAPVSEAPVGNMPTPMSSPSPTNADPGVLSFPRDRVQLAGTGPQLRSLAAECSQGEPEYRGALAPRPPVEPRSAPPPKPVRFSLSKRVKLMALGACIAMALVNLGWLIRPAATPRVLRTMQLTDFGLAWSHSKVVTDGTRLYFARREGSRFDIVQAALGGGEPLAIPTNLSVTILYDISPDRSKLLVGEGDPGRISVQQPVWILPLAGGTPRRFGDVTAGDAVWSAEGRDVFFAKGSALYVVSNDGTASRKLVDLPGQILHLSRAPSGSVLRFSLRSSRTGSFSLWEVWTDGSNLHPLLKGWKPDAGWLEGEFGGAWTPDGRYYLFTSTRGGQTTLWAIRERVDLLHRTGSEPVALYEGPLFLAVPLVDMKSRKIFVVGDEPESRELLRYNAELGRFEPYLQGMPVRWVKFSPDGKWVAYVRASDLTLWRSRADGSDRLQLTFPPLRTFTPDWSPDGRLLAFAASAPGSPSNIYTISRDGGIAQQILTDRDNQWDPNWLGKGKTILFGRVAPSYEFGSTGIYLLDTEAKQISLLPGSGEFTKPAVSPNGRYVAGLTGDAKALMLFDSRSGQWAKLAEGEGLQNLYWSRDSRQILFQDVQQGREQPIQRVRIGNRRVEQIASRDQLFRSDVRVFSLTGIALDGSPLVTLIRSKADVYELDAKLP
jgi:Tol biopolymer transport system component/DNA-binding winged helix-turn-helix (wHTH) protein